MKISIFSLHRRRLNERKFSTLFIDILAWSTMSEMHLTYYRMRLQMSSVVHVPQLQNLWSGQYFHGTGTFSIWLYELNVRCSISDRGTSSSLDFTSTPARTSNQCTFYPVATGKFFAMVNQSKREAKCSSQFRLMLK